MFKFKYLGRIEYDFQKSRVTGSWDHKDSVPAKKVFKKNSCLCTFKYGTVQCDIFCTKSKAEYYFFLTAGLVGGGKYIIEICMHILKYWSSDKLFNFSISEIQGEMLDQTDFRLKEIAP
jgi:hypothetical protein